MAKGKTIAVKKKSTRGGKRAGAGAKEKARKTRIMSIRVWDNDTLYNSVKAHAIDFAKNEEERVRTFEL